MLNNKLRYNKEGKFESSCLRLIVNLVSILNLYRNNQPGKRSQDSFISNPPEDTNRCLSKQIGSDLFFKAIQVEILMCLF